MTFNAPPVQQANARGVVRLTSVVVIAVVAMIWTCAASPNVRAEQSTNRLIHEKSPYLLQHAHNPVDWFPWGEEAFAKARKEGKPIFLSVGYSTCHWCHVMEHECFENAEIAKLMNERFVNIKVDREERPDVDQVYMTFVQATTGSGGWPMNLWLTPDLKPFAGGTYFPPEAKDGLPGFRTLLTKIADGWRTDRTQLVTSADQVLRQLQTAVNEPVGPNKLASGIREKAYGEFAAQFDPTLGGFGAAPKFPRPVTFSFLFDYYGANPGSAEGKHALEMALVTLRKMAEGGIHDHIGGGFHRYSTDKFWHVPHFEKTLYDQAEIAIAYLTAFQITHDPLFETVARDVLSYVERDLTAKDGGCYSAEDADSLVAPDQPENSEGAFYVWTKDEIDMQVGRERAKIFDFYYGVESKGNTSGDSQGEFKNKNILIERHSLGETAAKFDVGEETAKKLLAEGRELLFAARAKRPRPHLDDKVVTSWNGLMISAFAKAHQVLGDPSYLTSATHAADFARQHLYRVESNTLLRSYRDGAGGVNGFASDYAFLVQGLLDLYGASFDSGRVEWALKLQAREDELFRDAKDGGYFTTGGEDSSVLLRMKEAEDGAEPSANSVSALNLMRIGYLLDRKDARERSEQTQRAFAPQLNAAPSSMAQMLVALGWTGAKPKQVVIAGQLNDHAVTAMVREVYRHFAPHEFTILADGGEGQRFFGERIEFIKSVAPLDGKATAYVCENFVCQLPTADFEQLAKLLTEKK